MPARPHAPVQMLWVGGPLSTLERLALTSWLANGHELHLYSYGKPANTPRGLHIRDAREILPAPPDTQRGVPGVTPVRFADKFAYALLCAKGGIWADIDVVCLRALDFAAGMSYFFASEVLPGQPEDQGKLRVRASGCVMQAPAGSPLLRDCLEAIDREDTTGPLLLHGAIERYNMTSALLNPNVFCPVPFWNMTALLAGPTVLPPESYGVHLWAESWRRNMFDKDAGYEPLSLIERLKTRYLSRKDSARG